MSQPIDVGTGWELFVDEFLIEEMQGTQLELQRPAQRNIAFQCDAPWEDDIAAFKSVCEDNGTVRFYYRASIPDRSNEANVVWPAPRKPVQVLCY